jgi:hypothetical protein
MKLIAGALAAATALTAVAVPAAQARPWHHRGGGGAAIGGFVAGALIGGALASSQRGYYGPGYGYGPGYAYGPPAYAPAYSGGDEVGYCMSRFKSYDPGSGTYLGYDGLRHPCP